MGKIEDEAIRDGMREAIENFDPGRLMLREVHTVWQEEKWERPTLIGVAASIEVARVMAENYANKYNYTLRWETREVQIGEGQMESYLCADIDELTCYTVRTEKVHYLIVKDPPIEAPAEPKQWDFLPSSKYGIICDNCGKQGMSYPEYMNQLAAADSLWKCIHCGEAAEFDQDRYEAGGL